jgi:hypothetical protein
MSDILARLKGAHDARKMVRVHVPEYGMDLHFPPLTLADHERIRQGINPKDEYALMVSALIHQAKNADGTPAFDGSPEVRAELHRMELGVLQRIMAEASGDLGEAAASELAGIDIAALRAGLISGLGRESKTLVAAVQDAQDGELLQILRNLAAAQIARQPLKNG